MYYLLFSSLLFLFSFGQLGRISFLHQEVNLYAYEVILGILLAVFLWKYRLQPFKKSNRLIKSIMLFLSYLAFSYLISLFRFTVQENIVGFLYLIRLIVYFIFFIYLLHNAARKDLSKKFSTFLHFLIFGFFGITIGTSLGQFSLYPDIRNLWYAGWDPHLNRMVGVFLEPPISGAIYGLLFFYFALRPKKMFPFKIFALTVLFIFILLTYSRGTYLGFMIALFLMLAMQLNIKRTHIIAITIIFLASLFVITKLPGEGANLARTSTIITRLENYQEGFRIWSKNPILGVGYNHIRYVREAKPVSLNSTDLSHAEASFHSSFLVILVASGVIGLIFFVFMLYELAMTSQYSMYAAVFLSISSLTDNVILHPFILFLAFFIIAVSTIHLSDK